MTIIKKIQLDLFFLDWLDCWVEEYHVANDDNKELLTLDDERDCDNIV